MEPLLKSDIFFFITSIAVVLLTTVLVIAGYYLIKTLKNVSEISETVNETVIDTKKGLSSIGERVSVSPFLQFFFGKKKNSKKHTK